MLKHILTELPKLSTEELKQIKTKVDFLLQVPLEEGKVEIPILDWLTEGFVYELKRRGILGGNINWARVIKQIQPHSYRERCESIRDTLLKGSTLTTQEHIVLGRIVARALADYLTYQGPVSLKKMLHNIYNVLIALDNSYPQYVESGMINFLVRKTSVCS